MWTVDELFKNTVQKIPDQTAIIDARTREHYSYATVDERVDRIAAGLQAYDIAPGDRVGIALANTPAHVFTALAVQRIGAVAVPFNFRINADKLRFFVADMDPELIVYGEEIGELVADLKAELACDTFVTTGETSQSGIDQFESLHRESDPEPVSVSPDDLSVIQYSSGTTGKPSGIEITHRVGVNRVFHHIHSQRSYDRDVLLGEIPLCHTVGFHGNLLTMVATEGTYVPAPKFEPEHNLAVIDEEDITALHAVPIMFDRTLSVWRASEQYDRSLFGSVNFVTSTAAPISDELFEQFKSVINPEYLYNVYGMSEIFPPYTKINLRNHDDHRIFGFASSDNMRTVEMGSHDPTEVTPPGEEGELIIRRDTVCAFEGYWSDHDSASATIIDGWYFTGDAALETPEGYYRLTGRLDDRIKFVGENVYPENVEAALLSHPSVESVDVFGVDDDEWGEVPKALVVADSVTAEELEDHCLDSEMLEDYKRPREFEFVEDIPNSAPI
ncbi:class I adenylate-forming enzyme family protein [Haloarcula salinisoli]|uniref:Acyl--CoA ligase n=1 Tax=Haloarcula salinisoli TaxID=2487746 RepID=A0A8J8CBB0_9EURY|nr:class I adenylate-forming enzyme family protein [Halomicroarcula salinisoli]MBX0288606.1 acyl--CoA ligase [Halomicroarcula salinisoli]MBX0306014.1 acyl--CoA ligase [Halomicroarcula salinisoli]